MSEHTDTSILEKNLQKGSVFSKIAACRSVTPLKVKSPLVVFSELEHMDRETAVLAIHFCRNSFNDACVSMIYESFILELWGLQCTSALVLGLWR